MEINFYSGEDFL